MKKYWYEICKSQFTSSTEGTSRIDNLSNEWIWVEGYKGTDSNMECKDFKYEMNTQYDMPDGEVVVCKNGFHLCVYLKDVYNHYHIGSGNRFFKVKALVRKSEYIMAGTSSTYWYGMSIGQDSKLTSKSIIFTEELTIDEILKPVVDDLDDWTEEDKRLAIDDCFSVAQGTVEHRKKVAEMNKQIADLTELGYSETFTRYIVDDGKYTIAHAVGTQEDLSMDMKVFAIMKG